MGGVQIIHANYKLGYNYGKAEIHHRHTKVLTSKAVDILLLILL